MRTMTVAQSKLLGELMEIDKSLQSEWSAELGVCRKLEGRLAKPTPNEKPPATATRFVRKYRRLLGGAAAKGSYRVFRNVQTAEGGWRVSLQHVVDRLVVLGGQIVVNVDAKGVVRRAVSSLPRDVEAAGKATVTQESLVRILRKLFMTHPEAQEYLAQAKWPTGETRRAGHMPARFPLTSRPKLVLRRVGAVYHPTWTGLAILPVDVTLPAGPGEWVLTQAEYYLDATDGELLKTEATIEYADVATDVQGHSVLYSGATPDVVSARGIQTDGADYFLKNIDNTTEIITCDADGEDDDAVLAAAILADTLDVSTDADGDWAEWTDSTDTATRNDAQQPEIDAHRFAAQIYDYYQGLGWEGFDNDDWDGPPVRVVTHAGMSPNGVTGASLQKYENTATGNMFAFIMFHDGIVDGGDLTYDFFAGELGTVAHEYQHAVTYFGVPKATGEAGGLYSEWVRGSMREAYSDSFAGLISGVWMLRAPWPEGVARDGEPLRRIEYPRSADTLSGSSYHDHYDDIVSVNDKYENSTVVSHAAFLLGAGGVHDRPTRAPQYIPVPSIGRSAVAEIWHRALTQKLDGLIAGDDAQRLVDLGKYLLESADELYGTASKEYVLLRRALYAVGLHPYDTTTNPYTKQTYGGEACMLEWGNSWWRSQAYLGMPMFQHWTSLDLFIDNGAGQGYDATIGEENKVFARVRNIGDEDLADVTVEFWYRKCGSGLPPDETDWRRCEDALGTDTTLIIANLPAGSNTFDDAYTDADAVLWYLDPAEITDEVHHFCLRAKILCDAPNHDNDYENYVQSNIQHVEADPDGDTDATIAFRVGNFVSRKTIPADVRIEHTLPKGISLQPTVDVGKISLRFGEERTIKYKLVVPGQTIKELRPPFDGDIEGKVYGDLCGRIRGTLSGIEHLGKGRIVGTIAARVGSLGMINGRIEGELSLRDGSLAGRGAVLFSPSNAMCKPARRMVGVKVTLRPTRVVNFAQLVNGEAVGGVTMKLVVGKKP